jgi:hypothetical protein
MGDYLSELNTETMMLYSAILASMAPIGWVGQSPKCGRLAGAKAVDVGFEAK